MLKILILTMFGLSNVYAAPQVSNPTSITLNTNGNQKEKVAARLQEFTDAFNQGQGNVVSSYWSDDAEIATPNNGQVIDGKEAITKFIQNKIQSMKGKTLKFEPRKFDFPDEDSATVEGVVQIFENGNLVDRQARRVGLVKQNGKWLIDTLSEIPVQEAPTSYQHLKELDFLLGNWKDEDENVTIQFNGKWDKYRNFLTQTFDMKIYGVDTLEGLQIIGWDPIKKEIRSWIYDSDGGFGSGVWTKIDGGWSNKLNYTLSDGTTAESTNTYTKIGDKSYTYASTQRKVGDKELPAIDPVTVVKE